MSPVKFTANEYFAYNVILGNDIKTKEGYWVPARPLRPDLTFKERFKMAWDVFCGRADALYWMNNQ